MNRAKKPVNPTSVFSRNENDVYLCTMDINIFSSDGSKPGVAVRRHLLTLLTAILLNLAFWYIQSIGAPQTGMPGGWRPFLGELLSTIVEMVVLMEASFAVSKLVINVFWKVRYSFASLVVQNILLLLGVVLIASLISLVYAHLFPGIGWMSWDVFLCDVLIAYFLTSLFFSTYLSNRYQKEKTLAQQVTIEKLKLKTDNHFVFNSLATLGTLIETNPEAAASFNRSMSRMYRYIVSKGDATVVLLSEELAFMEEYRKNLAVRHADISIHVDDQLSRHNWLIPPLTLQGLVENAVKHNRHGSNSPLNIDISLNGEGSMISVSNNRAPIERSIEESPRSGLATLDLRYQTICGKGIIVEESLDTFTVFLPVIHQSDLLC
ncbi:MAG: histidine kinase [Bacteroidales bacterium]|nr:histidine kinase [Bacteroidales bacterium]